MDFKHSSSLMYEQKWVAFVEKEEKKTFHWLTGVEPSPAWHAM